MEKSTIFSKLNIKDYNNELEKILEHKLFSLEVKNLLLSMLYKIENAYEDYKTVKVDVPTKKEFIENLLHIIQEDCHSIHLVNPITEDDVELRGETKSKEQLLLEKNKARYVVDKSKGTIICYQNEFSLLSAVIEIGENRKLTFPFYPYCEEAANRTLHLGHNMNQVEVIRDFNGWSWDIVVEQMDSILDNFTYQILRILGEKILYQKKAEEYAKFKELFYELALLIYLKEDKEKLAEIKEIYKQKQAKIELFNNKKELVETVTKEKKECIKEIERIDMIMTHTELLRKEYQERNSKLPNKEKIFSISHLAERMEHEREELLQKISEYNKVIIPKEFIKQKEELKKELTFLEDIQIKDLPKKYNAIIKGRIIEYCKAFLQCAGNIIEKEEDQQKIIDWFYKLRYYLWLPIDKENCIKDIKEIQQDIQKTIDKLVEQAYKYKVVEIFSQQKDLISKIFQEVFYMKMINLENLVISCNYQKGALTVEYNDTNILEKTITIEKEDVRIKKKFKLFII